MDEKFCSHCRHYIQHYAFLDNRLTRIYCGHCAFSAVKRKRPDAAGCEHFVPGSRDIERFVSKEYLSKALLDRVLKLDLLPEIGDAER